MKYEGYIMPPTVALSGVACMAADIGTHDAMRARMPPTRRALSTWR
jgi:hypothetical protein